MPDSVTTDGRFAYAADHALARAGDGYFTWLDHIWHAVACTHPIRLRGRVQHIDPATGELLRTITTDMMPDQVMYKPCGNRRATTCPGCAETYRRDAYHLIRAGLIGGKGITLAVATHPAVFATFTAPSFGTVHTRPVRQHTCTDRTRCTCQPQPCHARRNPGRCEHGRHNACFTRHHRDDTRLGQPLCLDCYDYNTHAVWNNQAGELWRRTKQAIERHLGQLARQRGVPPIRISCGNGTYRLVDPIRVVHGKAAEYQARGAVHFHVLLRLDGYDPADPDTILPPPPGITAADLEDATRHAAAAISYRTKPHPAQPSGWLIRWGDELDVRVITMRGTATITDLAVASYLAKYATKSTETTGHTSARLTTDTIDLYANPAGTHPERLIAACWRLGRHPDHTRPAPLGPHARLRRPLPHQSPPLLHPLPRPPPSPHHLPPHPRHRTRTPAPSAPPTTPTTKPPSSSAPSPTPEPAGQPAATPSSPTPPPTKPANAAKPDTTNSPTNTTASPWVVRRRNSLIAY